MIIRSPCLGCIRKDENKNDYTCTVCPARGDFTRATQGDKNAHARYIAFDYPDLGAFVETLVGSRSGRKIVDAEYYQRQYYPAVAAKIKGEFGLEFKTIKEVLIFLYDKYKSQRYIANNFFKVNVKVIRNMLTFFKIKTLSMSEIKKNRISRRGKNFETPAKTDRGEGS